MRLTSLTIGNYKSLRQVTWEPGPLTVIVGANASGKSNLADFHDFLSDLYRHGLPVAVARKGGYENIAHRKMRRSRGAITVSVTAEVTHAELRKRFPFFEERGPDVRFVHSFAIRAEGRAIRSDFRVEHELIRLERKRTSGWDFLLEIERTDEAVKKRLSDTLSTKSDIENSIRRQLRVLNDIEELYSIQSLATTELLLDVIGRFLPILRTVTDSLGAIRVFQISPTNTRESGVPIPNPEMDRFGGNLPAVVDMIVKRHPRIWSSILDVMRQLLPGLERIEVDYTPSRTLGIFFHEKGVGRPWNVAEISDGTVHSLAMLIALHDPRATMLVLEEPENSVHTWILRTLMGAAVEASSSKQIVVTTHSRVVVDSTDPGDVWVMWKKHGESRLDRLISLDPDVIHLIEDEGLTTFEVLDSGTVLEALPPEPQPEEGLDD